MTQLPVYVPNEEEQKDPEKYSKNVRKYMVRLRNHLAATCAACRTSRRCRARMCVFLSLACTPVQRMDIVYDCGRAACIR